MEYFRALRTEITEAQKLRVQVGLAKMVFLGSLLGFFLKDAKGSAGSAGILICPFVALMFDCMVYGLSFNIREIGSYIGAQFETAMMEDEASAKVTFWQTYRQKRPYVDWGRFVYRIGSYGLSVAASGLSFLQVCYPSRLVPLWLLTSLGLILVVGWSILIWLEFSDAPVQHPSDGQKPQS